MADYIKRQAALDAVHDILNDPNCPLFVASTIDQVLSEFPSAIVKEDICSKWIEVEKINVWGEKTKVFQCLNCNKNKVGNKGITVKSDFCPNCGARMVKNNGNKN